eukprot:gnl/MRDRNA2_/MRDRNA2_126670_c0_seq1.p1 gnl/MRDRNA2_/MRDRNA2_126670_c0~~gnl/MRDRNA2_/MRDRNA2_126670_c0_seq1.p1  ORF type:complete len:258 (-),score=41.22 gnl/MRDRNA2_/MRDRNA2_126670_c0_seq1:196-969(-)
MRSLCMRFQTASSCWKRYGGLVRQPDHINKSWNLRFTRSFSEEVVQRGRSNVSSSYAVRSVEDQKEHYRKWAVTYDDDQNARGWFGPQRCAEILAEQLEPSKFGSHPVLDAGAGTGLMGPHLQKLGFQNVTALDLSDAMLAEAAKTGAYSTVTQGVLGEKLPFDSNSFDAVVSSGTFTEGHAPASSFDELVRITKPEGRIIFTLKCDIKDRDGFTKKFDELTAKGQWELVKATDPGFFHLTSKAGDPMLQIWSFNVL